MTYGDIRFRLTQLVPGISLDLWDGWVSDRYTEILDRIKWKRREVRSVLQTSAIYQTGTLTLTAGSTAVTGVATVWTAAMSGCGLNVASRTEFYEWTYLTAHTGTLDRPFEGTSGSYSYKLYQSVYPLPSDCKILESVTDLQNGPLERMSRRESQEQVGLTFGAPLRFRQFMDDTSATPRIQIELWPIPDTLTSLAIEYVAEETAFIAGTSTPTLLPWLRPACLVAGAQADALAHKEQFRAAERQGARFEQLLSDMVRTAKPAQAVIRIAPEFQSRMPSDMHDYLRRLQMP